MKRYTICFVCICILILSACGGKSNDFDKDYEAEQSDDYLSHLQETYEATVDEDEPVNELYPQISEVYMNYMVADGQGNILRNPFVEYSGERLRFRIISNVVQGKENGPDKFSRLFYILVNGYRQPFYVGDSTEAIYSYRFEGISGYEDEEFEISFDPIYVPYGENAVMSFLISNVPDYVQNGGNELVTCLTVDSNYCLTAKLSDYAVDFIEPEVLISFDDDFKSEGEFSLGIALTEKLTNKEQLKVNTRIESSNQLYATVVGYENVDLRMYAVLDGEFADVFAGSCFADINVLAGKTYEIPLDMDIIEKNKLHQICFVAINMDVVDAIKKCETKDEIREYMLTYFGSDYIYAFTCG